jgi:hypothetical protein
MRTILDRQDTLENMLTLCNNRNDENGNEIQKISSGMLAAKLHLVDILPFENNDDIYAFIERDSQYNERISALAEYMRFTAEQSSTTKFVRSLARGIFDVDYLATHCWERVG